MPNGTRLNCSIPVHSEAGPAHLLIQAPALGKLKATTNGKIKKGEMKKDNQLLGIGKLPSTDNIIIPFFIRFVKHFSTISANLC